MKNTYLLVSNEYTVATFLGEIKASFGSVEYKAVSRGTGIKPLIIGYCIDLTSEEAVMFCLKYSGSIALLTPSEYHTRGTFRSKT